MGVSAKVIAHSKSAVTGKEIITFELEYPRIIHSEFMTHNALSKNSSSSRAIPVEKMIQQVRENPAMPVRFGKKNKGMQDAGEHGEYVSLRHFDYDAYPPEVAWEKAGQVLADFAEDFHEAGYAKQICNRLIEPFQQMKVVMTATELNNFIWLRDHPAADPTIEALAKAIKKAKEESIPFTLNPGEWHLPYIRTLRGFDGEIIYAVNPSLEELNVESCFLAIDENKTYKEVCFKDALTISISCCAQVSFRSLDDSLDKAQSIVEKLNLKGQSKEPVHASPTEHQATPIASTEYCLVGEGDNIRPNKEVNQPFKPHTWQEGITHVDRDGTLCSGNLKGFVQYRQLIPNNVKLG